MTAPRWNRVKSVFHAAQRLPRVRRESFVLRECGGDEAVADEALRLVRVRSQVLSQSSALSAALQEQETLRAPTDVDGALAAAEMMPGQAGVAESPSGPSADLPRSGDVIADRYELGEELGCGGFGTVFVATDRIGRKPVAVKIVALTSRFQAERYRRELATLRRARVPGVVELHDDGNVGPWAFLVMRLVEGTWFPGDDLQPTDVQQILERAVAFLEALARLHAVGVFHRDVKPANVLVNEQGHVTIVDLGIAEDRTDPERWRLDRPLIGTPPYMSPERREGAAATARSDIYAAGVLLLETILDEPVQLGDNRSSHRGIVRGLLAGFPDEVPAEVRSTIRRMVAWAPEDRPGDVAAVLQELAQHVAPRVAPLLPRLGGRAVLDRILEAADHREPLDLTGRPGAGRSRMLVDAEAELRERGHVVLRVEPGCSASDPLARLVPGSGSGRGDASPERSDQALLARLRNWLADGAVLIADDADQLDPATQRELEELRDHGCVLRAVPSGVDGRSVEVPYLRRDDLLGLVRSRNRLYRLRDQVADLLWERTRGGAASVGREIESWCSTGLASWNDGLVIEPDALPRIRSAGHIAIMTASRDALGTLHPTVLDVWDAVSIAGTGLNARAIAAVLERAPRRVAAAFPVLVAIGAIDVDEDGRAWAIAKSPRLHEMDSDARLAFSHRIADQLPPGSDAAFRHLVLAERHDEACRTALAVAESHIVAGRNADALLVLDAALPLARRHLGHQVALYDDLVGMLARVAVSLTLASAIELARYHVELAPAATPSTLAWDELLHAAAKVLQRDAEGGLRILDDMGHAPSHEHRRLKHIVAHLAAMRTGDPVALQRRTYEAVVWARAHASRETRSLVAAFTGWLRFEQGRYAAAASLQSRAARLTRSKRARVSALLNAASAAVENGALDVASRHAELARPEASACVDAVSLARAERLLRVIAYRSGEVLDVDEDLLAATDHLSTSVLRGLTALNEAAIAWRRGRLARAAELSQRAQEGFAHAPRSAPALLTRALAATARSHEDPGLRSGFTQDIAKLAPIGVTAQAAALFSDVCSAGALPSALVERCLEWARAQPNGAMRREVLSPDEVAHRLTSKGSIDRTKEDCP